VPEKIKFEATCSLNPLVFRSSLHFFFYMGTGVDYQSIKGVNYKLDLSTYLGYTTDNVTKVNYVNNPN